jgi:hypothetical protein
MDLLRSHGVSHYFQRGHAAFADARRRRDATTLRSRSRDVRARATPRSG